MSSSIFKSFHQIAKDPLMFKKQYLALSDWILWQSLCNQIKFRLIYSEDIICTLNGWDVTKRNEMKWMENSTFNRTTL